MDLARQQGFLLNGAERLDGEPLPVLSPWDRTLVGTATLASREQAADAAGLLAGSFEQTRSLATFQRQAVLQAMAAALRERRQEFAARIVAEAGKPITAARAEVDRAVLTFETAAAEAARLGGEVLPLDLTPGSEGRWGVVRRFPAGPVLAITPFNFPVNLVAHKLAPAIAAGCPILVKPAPQTPFSSLALGRLAVECGWPAAAVAVLPLSNENTAWLAAQDDRFKVLSFTGSAAVGWQLKQASGRKRVLLELGGNAAVVVCADWYDLRGAACKIIDAAMGYAGQSCISVQRVLVERSVFEDFVHYAVEHASQMRTGDPSSPETQVGPMIRPEDCDRVQDWLSEARLSQPQAAGATLLCGGTRHGSVLAPTLLTGTRPGMRVLDEEVFAPLAVIEPFDGFPSALDEVNRSRYGLQAGLYTCHAVSIEQAFQSLQVGALIVGDVPTWRMDPMPYGGVKDSGLGREGLRYAIEEFSDMRLLVMALQR